MQLLKTISKFTTRRLFLQLIVIAVAVVILMPQLESFLQEPIRVSSIDASWLLLALTAMTLSYIAAAGVYVALLSPRITLSRTVVAQIATSFTNRLLPGGIGGMGTYVRFLHTQKVSSGDSAVAVGANQLTGIVSFVLLAVWLGLTTTSDKIHISLSLRVFAYVALTAVIAVMVTVTLQVLVPKVGKKLSHFFRQVWLSTVQLARQPLRSLYALLSTFGITLCYVVCLYACLRAVGVELDLRQILLVYMGGSIAGSVAPTPGGLGPIEAALVAGLHVTGVAASPAITAVLLYRLITFWLPVIPGYIAFRYLLKKHYL